MIKTIKIKLLPNRKQQSKMFQSCGAKRFAYNWALGRQKEHYDNGGKFLKDTELRKEFTRLKKQDEYKWLNDISNNVIKQAIKDSCFAYKRFLNHKSNFPKFKSRKIDTPSFYVDTDKISFTETHVKLEKISCSKKKNKAKLNYVKLAEKNKIPIGCNYYNPYVVYDGMNWFIYVGIEYANIKEQSVNDGIGIDVGMKDLAICSDGKIYTNINKTSKMKKLEKKKRRLQRSISRKYTRNKKGGCYKKTSNIIKSEKKLLKLQHKISNIRTNYLHQVTAEIIKRKPSFIVLESLNVSRMMKNKHLSKAIQEQKLYEFCRQIEYKANWNNIEVIFADRFYPRSETCSYCGHIKSDLKLSDRVYVCDKCGMKLGRDYNASKNLKNYYYQCVK